MTEPVNAPPPPLPWLEAHLWQLLAPAAVGIATGACVAGLSYLAENLALRQLASLPGAIPALFSPLALVLTVLVAKHVTRATSPSTSELYILTYHKPGGRIPLAQLPGRLLGALTTVCFGGSQGFESMSALLGVAWSDLLSRWFPRPLRDATRRAFLASGASAGIAAVFSSASVGTLYGIEVPFRRDLDAPRLAPCAIAAVCSYLTRAWLIGSEPIVQVHGAPTLDAWFLGACLIVAILCGLGARLFAVIEEGLRWLGQRQSLSQRAWIGGTILAILALSGHALCGSWITFGSGYIAADWLAEEAVRPTWVLVLAFLIRFSGNLVCVYGGGGGGVFTSLACNGIFLAHITSAELGGVDTPYLALIGAGCFLGSGYRLPLACMLFVAEQGGSVAVTSMGLVAIAVGQVLMGNKSVSEAQIDKREG